MHNGSINKWTFDKNDLVEVYYFLTPPPPKKKKNKKKNK